MKYNKIVFMKKNNVLVGVGIKPNGTKELLTLEEAIKHASVLKKESKYAVEFLNSKEKIDRFNNKKKKKLFNPKSLILTPVGIAVLALGIKSYALINKNFDAKAYNPKPTKTSELVNNENDIETFEELLNASTSITQREFVQMMADYIEYFNIDFANNYVEVVDGVEIKPALSWEYEVPALTIAFNDLTKNDIKEIFNGAELEADELDASYKNAILQLMGAYVISDSAHPVKIYELINDPEAKAYVQEYEELYYNIKDAKSKEEKVELAQKFYNRFFEDFPVTNREFGMSHAEQRELMNDKPEKNAIIPMLGALEMTEQNALQDVTLTDKEIEYLNDLGMCNDAYSSFEKVELITMCTDKNEKYADFKKLIELGKQKLIKLGAYVKSDKERDPSLLNKFQEQVSTYNENDPSLGGVDLEGIPGETTTKTTTRRVKIAEWIKKTVKTVNKKRETKTDDRKEAVDKSSEKQVTDAENDVRSQDDKTNKEAADKANKEADKKQKEEQAKADADRKLKEEEAKKANNKVNDDINNMNKTINDNNKDHDKTNDKPVNTNGNSNINIKDEHTDSNGNMNDSVKDVTKDGSNHSLPDPQETGKDFDAKANTTTSSKSTPSSAKASQAAPAKQAEPVKQEVKKEESKPAVSSNLPDPEETGKDFDAKGNEMMSKEALTDYLIQRLSTAKVSSKAKVLTRK